MLRLQKCTLAGDRAEELSAARSLFILRVGHVMRGRPMHDSSDSRGWRQRPLELSISCSRQITRSTQPPLEPPMFGRLNQLVRHLSRPLPNYVHLSAANPRVGLVNGVTSSTTSPAMAAEGGHGKGLIHTAACLIIGDEVLGGKVNNCGLCVGGPFAKACCCRLSIQTQHTSPSSAFPWASTSKG